MLTPHEQAQYRQRNETLIKLGFSSYKTYLASALWKSIRRDILLPHTRCRACGNPATQVHHNRYHLRDMNGASKTHLIPVCGSCHKRAEFTKMGTKVGPQRATAKLDMIRVETQKIWHRQDSKAAWSHFFATVEKVRIFVGMDESLEARTLVEELDTALKALPPRGTKRKKENRHKQAS
jgi:hypothetical protein